MTPWGRQEVFIANGSVTDPGTMAALTQAALQQTDSERVEYTRGVDFARAESFPFRDYQMGDFVWSTVTGAAPERLRIRQITLTVSDKNILGGNVVLNDRFLEADVRAKRRVDGITNGASGAAPIPDKPTPDPSTDKVAPGQVTGLTGSSAAYVGPGGFTQAQVTLSWAAVTVNADATPCDDLDRYEIFQRPSGQPISARQLVATTSDTTYSLSGFVAGSNWVFTVRAVDQAGNRGAYSADRTVGMASDTTPPQAPTAPTVTSKLGVLTVAWDGNPATGTWPPDFNYVEVHVSTVNNFTPTTSTYLDRLYGKGATVWTRGTVGVPAYFRLVAVDTSNLKSAGSAQASGTPNRLVGTDLNPDAITFEQIAFKDPGNIVPDGSFETATYRAKVEAQSGAAWGFVNSGAYLGNWAATVDGTVDPSTYRTLWLLDSTELQQIRPTEKLFGRMAYKVTPGGDGMLRLIAFWYDADGTGVGSSNIVATLFNGTWQQVADQVVAPTGASQFRIGVQLHNTTTQGVFTVDTVEVRRTVNTAIIEDAAIKNAHIDNLAVNSAKISDLNVGKLTSGSISATVLIAGILRTASAGARLELTGTGQRLYDSNSVLKGWWDPATGKLRIYNNGDASHTSTGHGLQFGDDNDQNLIMDNNEIMSRFNGSYGQLLLNREGGQVLIGGKIGGFATDGSDVGVFPADEDHVVSLRAAVRISNVSDAEYSDEYPPLLIGRQGADHLFFDSNEIGASSGDGPASLHLNPPRNTPNASGDTHHTDSVVLGSNSIGIRRGGSYKDGDRFGFIYSWDGANDIGIRFESNVLSVKAGDNTGFRAVAASAFTVSSSEATKQDITEIPDAIGTMLAAESKAWRYANEIEADDRWHFGPMLADLPPELRRPIGDGLEGYDVASLVGILWEGARRVARQVRQLPTFAAGTANLGSPLPAATSRDITITLTPAMPDANYVPTVSGGGTTAALGNIVIDGITARTATDVTVRVRNIGIAQVGAAQFVLSVIAIK